MCYIWTDVPFKTFPNVNSVLYLSYLKTSIIRLNYIDNHIWKKGQGFGKKDRFHLALSPYILILVKLLRWIPIG